MLDRRVVILSATAAAALAAYRWWRRRVMPVGSARALPGTPPAGDHLITLPGTGITRYRITASSAANAPLVVLVHGISYPGIDVWRGMTRALEARGCTVLAYDLTGRGWSHSSGEPLTAKVYVAQLEELLKALGLTGRPIDGLLGWSLGGVIASLFAARHPTLVRRLLLLAPGGLFSPGVVASVAPLRGDSTRARIFRGLFANFVAFVFLNIGGGLIFKQLEEMSYADGFYHCMMTATTIGLGDIAPVTQAYRRRERNPRRVCRLRSASVRVAVEKATSTT